MTEAIEEATATQLKQHHDWQEKRRVFFPKQPRFPIEPPRPVQLAPPPLPPMPPPMPKRIARLIGFNETKARMKIIRRMVCEGFHVTIEDIKGPRREKGIALPRHVYSYLAKRLTKASLPQIARTLDQDHTTVIHAVRRIEYLITIDNGLADRLRLLEARIRAEFGEREKPQNCIGRYVEHYRVPDYLRVGWMWAANLNEYAALLIWPCDCRYVEPKG